MQNASSSGLKFRPLVRNDVRETSLNRALVQKGSWFVSLVVDVVETNLYEMALKLQK